MTRRVLTLSAPDGSSHDFSKFPVRSFPEGSTWHRQHRDRPVHDGGAWWFASHAPGEEGDGRFDLQKPDGTCYLASTERAALNELLGPDYARRGWVDAPLLEGRVVSRLVLPVRVRAAATTSARAVDVGLTNELATTDRYDITQAWAATWRRAGFDGVHSALRFTPGRARGLALFGDAGAPDPPLRGDPEPRPVRPLVESHGVTVVDPPAFGAVTVVRP